jgi:hypothetical protein
MFIAPGDSAGVTPQKNWNNVPNQASGAVYVNPNLTQDTAGVGSPSGVKVSIQYNIAFAQVFGVVTNEGGALNTPDRQLMNAYADALGPLPLLL